MPKFTVEIVEWLPYERNTLLGFLKVRIKELRLVISRVALHQKNGNRWAQLLSKPMVKDGEPVRGPEGRITNARIFEFDTTEVQQAFSTAVLDAYDSYRPP